MTIDTDDHAPDDDADLAPRPRPGHRSKPGGLDMTQKAAVVAALFRAGIGLVGLAITLLWIPVPRVGAGGHSVPIVPVLAAVSILMMVTGCTSLSKVTRAVYPKLARMVALAFAAAALAVVAVTATLGAGAFGPARNPQPAPPGPATITFEPPPGR